MLKLFPLIWISTAFPVGGPSSGLFTSMRAPGISATSSRSWSNVVKVFWLRKCRSRKSMVTRDLCDELPLLPKSNMLVTFPTSAI